MEQKTFRCENCGGVLEYNPGVSSLKCPYCGTVNEGLGEKPPEQYEELDFNEARRLFDEAENTEEVQIVKCEACAAEVTLEANVTTAACDFCGTHIVASGKGTKVMLPQYILPFSLERSSANKLFKGWIRKGLFAPTSLKKLARVSEPLKGIYYPFWTFDTQTESDYRGERGVERTVEGKNGSETRVDWSPKSGHISKFFDDVLVPASRSLPEKLTKRLDQWDMNKMLSYNETYMSGFKAEAYSVDLEEGFSEAKEVMESRIRGLVKRDIGGDRQRIHRLDTAYSGITFKYIILPVWTLTYKFKQKYYQVLVNGQTGEIEGRKPVSPWKVALAVLIAIGLIVGFGYLKQYLEG